MSLVLNRSLHGHHFPAWLKRPIPSIGEKKAIEEIIGREAIHTVCLEAKCPNRGECFGKGLATFLILGDICTRKCGFCGVTKGVPKSVDFDEPVRLLAAVRQMGIQYVVITSVTRDDLSDGGASLFAESVELLRQEIPEILIEVLIPDFAGNRDALKRVIESKPDLINHNIETVRRNFSAIRPVAGYDQSLALLALVSSTSTISTKSGFMVGLGEKEDEVFELLEDLRKNGVTMVTIGQYLQPTQDTWSVMEFVTPKQFDKYRCRAEMLGFTAVSSGPFVRSSYLAYELFAEQQRKKCTTL